MATTFVTSVGTIAPKPVLYPGFPLEGGTYCFSFSAGGFAGPLDPLELERLVPPLTNDLPSRPIMSISAP